ncbi:hypothetical protein AGMMS50262_05220 [Bacteroidia bacterium]|nr:hypothetical protein AGMMS50262_05220 [Bacteroidia bacterium]
MIPNFDKFIHFGSIGNEEIRKELAENVFTQLNNVGALRATPLPPQIDNFTGAIHSILDNDTMHQMCHKNNDLFEKITSDILDFVNKTNCLLVKIYFLEELKEFLYLCNNFKQINVWFPTRYFQARVRAIWRKKFARV